MWPATPPCPSCQGPTEQIHQPKAVAWTVDPVVVFKAPDGTFRFPGDANGLSAAHYAQQGLERVEIRGAIEMRRFERTMNKAEYAQAQRRVERTLEARERREAAGRSALRQEMQSMSSMGRDVARAAMARNDAKPKARASDPGFISEVFSYDRGNREESRDAQGRRRRD